MTDSPKSPKQKDVNKDIGEDSPPPESPRASKHKSAHKSSTSSIKTDACIPNKETGGASPPGDPRRNVRETSPSLTDSSTTREKESATEERVPPPPLPATVSDEAFRVAVAGGKSPSQRKGEQEGSSSPRSGVSRSIKNALGLSGGISHSASVGSGRGTSEMKKDTKRPWTFSSANRTPPEDNLARRVSNLLWTLSTGGAFSHHPDGEEGASSRGRTPDKKPDQNEHVSNILWDLTLRAGSSNLSDEGEGSSHLEGGGLPAMTHPTSGAVQQKPSAKRLDISLYKNGESLEVPAEDAEAERIAKALPARRERIGAFWALCSARCCLAVAALLAMAVGFVVGVMVQLRRHQGEGAEKLGIEAGLEEKCTEDKVRQWKGYSTCHDLCEQAYCCFIPDWDSVDSCAEARKDWCTPFVKHCIILDLIDEDVFNVSPKNAVSGEDSEPQDHQ